MKNEEINIADLFLMLGEQLKNSPGLTMKTGNDLLTPQEVCTIYPCFNDGTLRDATKKGLPYHKIGKHRYYKPKEIDDWIDKQVIIEGN